MSITVSIGTSIPPAAGNTTAPTGHSLIPHGLLLLCSCLKPTTGSDNGYWDVQPGTNRRSGEAAAVAAAARLLSGLGCM